jgi:hypothetical protein
MDRWSPSPEASMATSPYTREQTTMPSSEFSPDSGHRNILAGNEIPRPLRSADGALYVGSVAGPIRKVDPEELKVLATIDAPVLGSNLHMIATENGTVVAGGAEAAGLDR